MKMTEQFIEALQQNGSGLQETNSIVYDFMKDRLSRVSYYELDETTLEIIYTLTPEKWNIDLIRDILHNLPVGEPLVLSFEADGVATHFFIDSIGTTQICSLVRTMKNLKKMRIDSWVFNPDNLIADDGAPDEAVKAASQLVVGSHIFRDLMSQQVFVSETRSAAIRAPITNKRIGKQKYGAVSIALSHLGVVRNTIEKKSEQGHTGSGKRRHLVKSFLRYKRGKVETVKSHWRGTHIEGAPPIVRRVQGIQLQS